MALRRIPFVFTRLFLALAMSAPLKTLLIAAVTSVATTVACFVVIHTVLPESVWKATGDGRTIFNSKTGELRYAATGQSVAEMRAEREQATQQAKREQEDRDYLQKTESERNAERNASNVRRESIRAQNSAIYLKVKKFVDDHPRITPPYINPNDTFANYQWEQVTQPFRTGQLLTSEEHKNLLDFLGRVIINEPYKSDPSFREVIAELNKWDWEQF
jgi:hypothetical protein